MVIEMEASHMESRLKELGRTEAEIGSNCFV